MNKTTKIIFIVSILINVFFAGSMVANAYKHYHRREEFRFTKKFSDENKELKQNVNAQRTKLFEILKSDNFNKTEFDAQLKVVSGAQEEMYIQFMNDMTKNLESMSADERKEEIQKITKGFEHKGCKGKHGPDRRHGPHNER